MKIVFTGAESLAQVVLIQVFLSKKLFLVWALIFYSKS